MRTQGMLIGGGRVLCRLRTYGQYAMDSQGIRYLLRFLLPAGMVALGWLGLAGTVTPSPVLAATLLFAAVVLAVHLGRSSTQI